MEVYLSKLPAQRSETDLKKWLSFVSEERQKRLKRFVRVDDAYRSLMGDLLVQQAFEKKTGLSNQLPKVSKNAYGKPYLQGHPSFHYNISHSGDYVVCAVHQQEIGVDIEKEMPFDWHVAKDLFTEAEFEQVKTGEKSLSAFYDIWTLKESYIKAIGKGLAMPLSQFEVKKHSLAFIELTDLDRGSRVTDYTCRQYQVEEGYYLSICAYQTEIHQFCERPVYLSFEQICERLRRPLENGDCL